VAPQSAPLENLANSGCPHSSSDDWQQGQSQSHLSQPSQQGQSQSSQQQVVSATFTSSFIARHLHPFKPRSNPFSYASSGESPIHWLGKSLALPFSLAPFEIRYLARPLNFAQSFPK
jgi:hypothetical protein